LKNIKIVHKLSLKIDTTIGIAKKNNLCGSATANNRKSLAKQFNIDALEQQTNSIDQTGHKIRKSTNQ
jgi:hypothetical protein